MQCVDDGSLTTTTLQPRPGDPTTSSSSEADDVNTDLFTDTILSSEMRHRKPSPSKSILQSPLRDRVSRDKSVVWKDNLVEYRYIDGNPARNELNWGSIMYAVLLIVSSYVVYCLLHSVGIKPRGFR